MSEDLVLHMLVNIPRLGGSGLGFHRWLPGENDCLKVVESGMTFRLWWNLDCLDYVAEIKAEDIPKINNLVANRVHVEVAIRDVACDLAQYIAKRGEVMNFEGAAEKRDEFNSLAVAVYGATVQVLNRLVDVARTAFGQFWVLPLEFEDGGAASFFVASRAAVAARTFERVRWDPPLDFMGTVGISPADRHIGRDKWGLVQEELKSGARGSPAREFIAYAEQLRSEGHLRAAIIQAVSSLELALADFIDRPRLDLIAHERLRSDMEAKSLGKLRKKLGLQGSFSILIPLVLSAEQFPPKILAHVLRAINLRGTAVHYGQRRFDEQKVIQSLKAVRGALSCLEAVTTLREAQADAER